MFKINNFNFISVIPDNKNIMNKNSMNKNSMNENNMNENNMNKNKNSMISNNLNLLLVLPQEVINELLKINLNDENEFEKLKTLMYFESRDVDRDILDEDEFNSFDEKVYKATNLKDDELLYLDYANKRSDKLTLIKTNFDKDNAIYLDNLEFNINELNHLIYTTLQYCKNNATNIKLINYNEFIDLNSYKYYLYNHVLIFHYNWSFSRNLSKKIEEINLQRSYLNILVLNKLIINTKYLSKHKINFINEDELLEYFENNIKKQLNFDLN